MQEISKQYLIRVVHCREQIQCNFNCDDMVICEHLLMNILHRLYFSTGKEGGKITALIKN